MNVWKLPTLLRTLWIEESSHPEAVGSTLKQPGMELLITIQKICEPESKSCRFPRDLLPNTGDPSIEHVVQSISKVLTHDDSTIYRQLEVTQHLSYC